MHLVVRWRALAWMGLIYCLATAHAGAAAPVITSIEVGSGANRVYGPYGLLQLIIRFDQNVVVTGTPLLTIRIGSATRQVQYNSGTVSMIFYYRGERDSGPLTVTGPLSLNGGTIKSSADGTDASLAFAPREFPNAVYDSTPPPPPVITGVSPTSPTTDQSFTISGTAEPGTFIRIRPIFVSSSGATDASGKWTVTVPPQPAGTYTFTAAASDYPAGNESTEDRVTVTVRPSGAGTAPVVTKVAPPPDGHYGPAFEWREHWVRMVVEFSAPVIFSGDVGLSVRVGSETRTAYAANSPSGSGATSVTFLLSPSGNGSLTITGPLTGGSIKDRDGRDAVRTFTAVNASGVVFDNIDPAPPVITGVTPASPTAAESFTITGTAEPLAAIYTADNRTAAVDANGNWSMTFPLRAAGTYTERFMAMDRAGNPWGAMGANPPRYSPVTFTIQPVATITPPPPPPPPPPVVITPPPPATTPPPVATPPPAGGGTPPPTTPVVPVAQSIDFVSPVSSIVIGQPVQLGATSSAGLPIVYSIVSGSATLVGDTLTVTGPGPVVIRATQAGTATVLPATAEITVTAGRAAQRIALAASLPVELPSDGRLTLGATASSGLPVRFEVVSGPATIEGDVLRPTAASGAVVLRAVQGGNDAYDAATSTHTLNILPATRLINLSSRVRVQAGDSSRAFIAGFVIRGTEPKRILARVVGPGLGAFGVDTALSNPRLRVFNSPGHVVAENDDWTGVEVSSAATRVGAFALSAGSRDAVQMITLPPGAYTLHAEAVAGEGVVLAEIYDASDSPALETQQLINLSARAFVDTGEGMLTAGFVVTGSAAKRVLIRGIGPSLGAFGVSGSLADPSLKLFRGTTVIAQNDDWQSPQSVGTSVGATGAEISAAANVAGAFSLANGTKDAALLLTLAPGAYTTTVSGVDNSTGAGLVEVYEIRP